MTDSTARTVASIEADFYGRSLDKLVDGLHRLADEIGREGKPRGAGALGTGTHVSAAHSVLHSLMWGLANLKVDQLVDAAGRADAAAVAEATASETAQR